MDFSESYKNKQQDEIQRPYFKQSTFRLLTVCIYYLDDSGSLIEQPITVVSQSSNHLLVQSFSHWRVLISSSKKRRNILRWQKLYFGVMDMQCNSGITSFLNLFPPTVPICWLVGMIIKLIIAKSRWIG